MGPLLFSLFYYAVAWGACQSDANGLITLEWGDSCEAFPVVIPKDNRTQPYCYFSTFHAVAPNGNDFISAQWGSYVGKNWIFWHMGGYLSKTAVSCPLFAFDSEENASVLFSCQNPRGNCTLKTWTSCQQVDNRSAPGQPCKARTSYENYQKSCGEKIDCPICDLTVPISRHCKPIN